MLTVVLKLLQIADAERAYFGEKDFQQLLLVRGNVPRRFSSARKSSAVPRCVNRMASR